MNDLNLCQFIGRVGQAPEIKYMPNGKAVANFSIACNRSWKDQQGQKQEKAEWVRCTAYDKLAEIIGQYTEKGSQLYVSGRQSTRKWQDQQGQDRYTTEIIVDQMQMLGGGSGGGQNNGNFQGQNNSGGYRQGNSQNSGEARNQHGGGQRSSSNEASSNGGQQNPPMTEPDFDFDDDIPFARLFMQHRGMHLAC